MKKLNCTMESPLHDEFLEELLEIKDKARGLLRPYGAMAFGTIPKQIATEEYPEGTRVAYVITTVGDGISKYIEEYFNEGDYVKGMLADALADIYLFEMEKCWGHALMEECRKAGCGISRRLEIPQDLPMETQRAAFEAIGEQELTDMRLSEGFMFYPVKSICHVFLLSKEAEQFEIDHNCRTCHNRSCNMRQIQPVTLKVHRKGSLFVLENIGDETILDTLQREWPDYSAVCGKRGTCGKCRVRILHGQVLPSPEDRDCFTEEELNAGWRLSCKAYPLTGCELEASFGEEGFAVLTTGEKTERLGASADAKGYGIAVDMGTTTLAAQLIELSSGRVLETAVSVNHQRSFGADVISRIQASNTGKKEELRRLIREDLAQLIERLLAQQEGIRAKAVCIAGNTTMGHLLMGYSCETLGRLPFAPVNIEEIAGSVREILGKEAEQAGLLEEAEVRLLPGISAFVGADITAGLLTCGFDKREEVSLFLDLGTNGEMALGNKERIYATSTAAGPAFEGGNIHCGCGSIPGAICHVRIEADGNISTETIDGKPPVGLCGTGLVEAAAELLRNGFLDETGRLDKAYAKEGFPLARTEEGELLLLTQKDIRELQLAKAAVRAGITILTHKYGICWEDIRHVFLAGGFGYGMDLKKAARIGLLPGVLLDRVEVVGNTALSGAKLYLMDPEAVRRLGAIRRVSRETALAREPEFQDCYVDAMYFEE
ncbi:MAG: DUF4445 domain-containing protein [Lachnospiraceae bacterium]|nr:DUF4445 domain-containing protein [Lachnospiraceae bacterium]